VSVVRILWLIALVAAFSVGWLANGWRYITQISKADAVRAEQRAKAQADARVTEQVWQATADQLRRDNDEQVRAMRTRLDAALMELRNRPPRPATTSTPTTRFDEAPKGCTGAGLYEPDASFLIREAARADEIRAAYIQCAAQYEVITADGRR
jgi:hypothetical protein